MTYLMDAQQTTNLLDILRAVQDKGYPIQMGYIAAATAITESNIRRLANLDGQGMNLPNDGTGFDHDSAGIFQQRPGWGSIQDRMNAYISATLFLNRVPSNWTSLSPGEVAQFIQFSGPGEPDYDGDGYGDGENYTKNYANAVEIVNHYWSSNDMPLSDDDLKKIRNIVWANPNGLDEGPRFWLTRFGNWFRTGDGNKAFQQNNSPLLSLDNEDLIDTISAAVAAKVGNLNKDTVKAAFKEVLQEGVS